MSNKKSNARMQKWRAMINQGLFKDPSLLRSRIRKGIPSAVRPMVWPLMIKLQNFKIQHQRQYTYEKLIISPSSNIYQISLDIPRTFPEQQQSKVLRKSLNNVLKGISIVYPQVGYCQGMNFLALRLLQILEDEEAFWILNYLFEKDISIRKNFIDPKNLEQETQVFHELMTVHTPKVVKVLSDQKIQIQIFTFKWVMTLFSSVLNQELFYRIFEIFLMQGWSILYSVGITMLRLNQEKILMNSTQQNMFLINAEVYKINNNDYFMEEVNKTEILAGTVAQLTNKYQQKMRLKDHNKQAHTNRSSQLKQREHHNKNPILPKPQDQIRQQLHFQNRSEEITFGQFSLLNTKQKQ